jgi:hypothetical protein
MNGLESGRVLKAWDSLRRKGILNFLKELYAWAKVIIVRATIKSYKIL